MTTILQAQRLGRRRIVSQGCDPLMKKYGQFQGHVMDFVREHFWKLLGIVLGYKPRDQEEEG